jgi:hypothetical protein
VSQELSADVVQGALATGACGYVVKADAVSELVAAVNAVLRGERFVGSRFAGDDFARASDEKTVGPRHEVQFYSDDECFLDGLTQFIGAALKAGNAAIVFATESHRDSLLPRLQAHGFDIRAAIEQGRYVALDAAETLSIFMVGGLPDPVRFSNAAGSLFMRAAQAAKGEHPRVAVYGECGSLLWAQSNAEGAMRVERLLNEIATVHDVDILCGYPLDGSLGEQGSQIFQELCALHSAVHPS